MFKILSLTVCLWAAVPALADDIKLNAPYEGKFPGTANANQGKVYAQTLEVELTVDKLTISVTAPNGDNRAVAIALVSADDVMGLSFAPQLPRRKGSQTPTEYAAFAFGHASFVKKGAFGKTASMTVNSLPAGGKYTIVVLSNHAGEFTLTAKQSKAK